MQKKRSKQRCHRPSYSYCLKTVLPIIESNVLGILFLSTHKTLIKVKRHSLLPRLCHVIYTPVSKKARVHLLQSCKLHDKEKQPIK